MVICIATTFAACGSAEYYVTERPAPPAYVRPAAPGPTHVWVEGEWVWNNGRYDWKPGYWEASRAGVRYHGGHWVRVRGGWSWRHGYWR